MGDEDDDKGDEEGGKEDLVRTKRTIRKAMRKLWGPKWTAMRRATREAIRRRGGERRRADEESEEDDEVGLEKDNGEKRTPLERWEGEAVDEVKHHDDDKM